MTFIQNLLTYSLIKINLFFLHVPVNLAKQNSKSYEFQLLVSYLVLTDLDWIDFYTIIQDSWRILGLPRVSSKEIIRTFTSIFSDIFPQIPFAISKVLLTFLVFVRVIFFYFIDLPSVMSFTFPFVFWLSFPDSHLENVSRISFQCSIILFAM